MNTPTEDNIREIAEMRTKKRPDMDIEAVVETALIYVEQGKVTTAPQAVEWAIQRVHATSDHSGLRIGDE